MRVAALVGGLKAAGPFEVSYRVADVGSIWDDPLAGIPPSDDPPYDLIVVVSPTASLPSPRRSAPGSG